MGSRTTVEQWSDELSRLRAEHRQVNGLLALIQELIAGGVRSESAGDLFARSFPTLSRFVPFEVAVAVMIEQNLDLYVSTRPRAASLVSDELVAKIRGALESTIPVSFATTEVVVKAERNDLPDGVEGSGGLQQSASALLEQGGRAAGIVALYREEPAFDEREQQVVTIFATQMSMLLDAIAARQHIASFADTDELTGVWNKRYLRKRLPQEIERARTFNVPLSLIMFDIDEFKPINDRHGHVIGDVVLSELCGVVRNTIRPTDVLSRFGGDEFVIILPHTDVTGAAAVADRLLENVRSLSIPAEEEGGIACSLSIGIAQFLPSDASMDDLLRRADECMYQAKRAGRNRYTAAGGSALQR